eukprot:1178228-Prorocentrum_minimum.AAC.10
MPDTPRAPRAKASDVLYLLLGLVKHRGSRVNRASGPSRAQGLHSTNPKPCCRWVHVRTRGCPLSSVEPQGLKGQGAEGLEGLRG